VVRLSAQRTGRLYSSGNIPGTHLCWRLGQQLGHSAAEGLCQFGNRTRDLPVCRTMPQLTAPPRAPEETGDRGFRLIYLYRPYFVKKGTTHIISVLWDKQEDGSVLHFINALIGIISIPHIFLVILEDGVVVFLRILEDIVLKDPLHITQFSSKWQLAHFLQTGSTCTAILQSVIWRATVRPTWIHFHLTTMLYATSIAQWTPTEFPFEKLGKE